MTCAALALAACTSEVSPLIEEEDSSKETSNLIEVSAITRSFGDGSMTIEPYSNDEDALPLPTGNSTSLKLDLGINARYLVIADDFAIQNGDKLYENAAIYGEKHYGVTDSRGYGKYFYVGAGDYSGKGGYGSVKLAVHDIPYLYHSYVGKRDSEGFPYISESGVLTLVVYIWPGTLNNGKFESINLTSGYIYGNSDQPAELSSESDDYSIKVSAFKGTQGSHYSYNPHKGYFAVREGYSYVKVSVHISPKLNRN